MLYFEIELTRIDMILKFTHRLIFPFCILAGLSVAQAQTTYQNPPKEIADLVNAPITPSVVFSKNGDWMMRPKNQSSTPPYGKWIPGLKNT